MLILLLSPFSLFAQEKFMNVTAPGNHTLNLTIAPPVAMTGSQNPSIANGLVEVFRFDMTLAGPFNVQAPQAASANEGITPGSFDFTPWKATGADLLLKSGYSVTGDTLTIECRLYDLAREAEITAKRFVGGQKELRRMAHLFSDEIMGAITGEKGPFTSKIVFVSVATGNKEIYLMDYDGVNVQMLTANRSINLDPVFSPSGKEIVYTSYKDGNPDLFRKELYTGAEARIAAHRGLNFGGAWAPDGNRIALAMSKDGTAQIYLIDKDGRLLQRLTRSGAIDISPSWSPDGSQIALVSDREGGPQIFIMGADGKNVHRLTYDGNYNVSPSWSPKGDRIAYSRRERGGFQIHTINPDGSGDTILTSEGRNEHPRWSPDGRFITFSSTQSGKEGIYVMRADGTGQTRVSRWKWSDSQPDWTRW